MRWTLRNIIVVAIITLVGIILIVSLFGPKIGLLNLAAKLGIKAGESWLPTKPSEKLKPITEADIPEELKTEYDNLIEAFEIGIKAKAPCLIKYTLPDKFKDYKIKITSGETLYFDIFKEEQLFKHEEVDIKICITSGKNVAQNFYISFIKGLVIPIESTFNEVGDVVIDNKNKIKTNIDNYGIKGNFLYKPKEGYICFLTTKGWDIGGGCGKGNDDGIDQDCLNKLPNNYINLCEGVI